MPLSRKFCVVALFIFFSIVVRLSALAQDIPSTFGARHAAAKSNASKAAKSGGSEKQENSSSPCATEIKYSTTLPTILDKTGKERIQDRNAIYCYFNGGASGVTLLDQVQYLYAFGGGTNSMSADLIGASTDFGLHIALGSSVTAGTSTDSSTGSTSTSTAIQQLESGGDFYIKGILPLVDWNEDKDEGKKQRLIVGFVPRLGFNFQGFGSQNTITEATEQNWNGSVVANYLYPLIPDVSSSPVSFYVDGKTGYQGVQGAFARSIGLGHKLNFALSEVAAGFDFAGFRVGFQRFFGPASAFGQSTNNQFASWHMTVQFSPSGK